LSVLKGGGGEFEHHPTKDIAIFGLRNGAPWTGTTGIHADGRRRLAETLNDPADLAEADNWVRSCSIVGGAGCAGLGPDELEAVAARNLYLPLLRHTQSLAEVNAIIEAFRKGQALRPHELIPV
uniref:hypothetical protein n=1 Tax=Mycolicibacterium poriferae TaxID=39694 RepID=UPI00321BC9AA